VNSQTEPEELDSMGERQSSHTISSSVPQSLSNEGIEILNAAPLFSEYIKQPVKDKLSRSESCI